MAQGDEEGIHGVLLNFSVAVILSLLGFLIFGLLWVRRGHYKLPVLLENEHNYEHAFNVTDDKMVTYRNAFSYFKDLKKMMSKDYKYSFMEKYGFEHFFYLEYHRFMAVNFMYSFVAMAIIVVAYGLFNGEKFSLTLGRIVGIYFKGSKANIFLNTVVMTAISGIITYNTRKMMKQFRHDMEHKVRQLVKWRMAKLYSNKSHREILMEGIDEMNLQPVGETERQKRELERKADAVEARLGYELEQEPFLHFSMNTTMLYGCNPEDHDHKELLSFLVEKLKSEQKKNNGLTTEYIITILPAPDLVKLGKAITDLDESQIYWEHSPLARFLGKIL